MSKKKNEEIENFLSEANDIINKEEKITYSLDQPENNPTEVKIYISTGSTLLDYAIANRRNGGIPVGKLTEITALEGAGKTLLASHIAANAQKLGAVVFYADSENAISPEFMHRLGVNLKKISYFQPPSLERFFKKTEEIIAFSREKLPKDIPIVIILDSLAATPIEDEIEGTYNPKELMGVRAKAISLALRKLTQVVGYERVTLILINQLRMKMNLANPYQDPYVAPGGMGIPFHSSVRIRLKSKAKVKSKSDDVIGVQCNAKVIKDRVGPPYREANFPIMFDYGIDNLQSIYEFLKEKDEIKKDKGGASTLSGVEFKTSEWRQFYNNNKQLVEDLLEKLLTVRYNESDVNSDSITTEQDSEMES